jgi:hypothetical protein
VTLKLHWDEGTRYLEVDLIPGQTDVFRATHESGNPAKRLESKTWHFNHDGKHYRVQIQLTSPEEGK